MLKYLLLQYACLSLAYRYNLSADTIFSKCFFSVSSSSGVSIGGSVAMWLNENKEAEFRPRFILLTAAELLDAFMADEGISVMPKHVVLCC